MLTFRRAKSDPTLCVGRNDPWHLDGTTARWLAAAFVLYGLVATAFLAINVAPFQNPDESAHFERAAQLADGGLLGTRFPMTDPDGTQRVRGGGPGDPALVLASVPFSVMKGHPETRATRSMWAPHIHWSTARAMWPYATIAYPPFFYVPSAIGVLVGRAARMTVVQTLIVSRLLTGVAAVAVGAAAIACAGGAAVWLFAILTLPMSLSQIASSSLDALMLACSALVGALLVRALRWPSESNGGVLAGLVAPLVLVAMARPPYGALAVLPLGVTKLRLRWRTLAAATIVASVMVWSAITAVTALTNPGMNVGADPTAQLARLLADPLLVLPLAWNTLALYWQFYLVEFVGQLGSLDIALPPAYHVAARAMLVIAAAAAMLGLRGERIEVGSRLVIGAGLLLSAAGVFAILYVTWTVPGHAVVEGVQGRYFLPLALAGAALLPALGDTRWARLHDSLVLAVAAFPVVTLAVVMRAVVLRYYLG